MISKSALKYAYRSLFRHTRRTLLSIIGIGLGCATSLIMLSFVRGEGAMLSSAAAHCGVGHLSVTPQTWITTRNNNLRLTDWQAVQQLIKDVPGVTLCAPKSSVEGLLAFGTRVTAVEIRGVQPEVEQTYNRLIRKLNQGRYLTSKDQNCCVVGKTIMTRLDIELDDQLMVTVAHSDGEMSSAMLTVIGVVETGSDEMDAQICHITLDDMERLTGLAGVGSLTLLTDQPNHIDDLADTLNGILPDASHVVTWMAVMPGLAASVEIDERWTDLTIGIVTLVVFLGIASAQLTAVLERRREFAVLTALGMKGRHLVSIMIIEGICLGVAGSVLSLLLSFPAIYYIATAGIDFGKLYGEENFTMSNILIDPILFGDMGWWLLPYAFGISLTATILSSLYPAWFALSTDPSTALRVEH